MVKKRYQKVIYLKLNSLNESLGTLRELINENPSNCKKIFDCNKFFYGFITGNIITLLLFNVTRINN